MYKLIVTKMNQSTLTQIGFFDKVEDSQELLTLEENSNGKMYEQENSSNFEETGDVIKSSNVLYKSPEASNMKNAVSNILTDESKLTNGTAVGYSEHEAINSPIRPGTDTLIPIGNNVNVSAIRPWVRVELGAEQWIEKKGKKSFLGYTLSVKNQRDISTTRLLFLTTVAMIMFSVLKTM